MDENVDYTVSPSLPTAALAAPDVADEAAPGAGPALTAGATTVAPGPAPTLDPSPDRGPSLRPGAPDAASLSPLPGLAPGPSPAAGLRLRTEAPGPGLSPRAGLSLQGTTNPSLKPTGHCQVQRRMKDLVHFMMLVRSYRILQKMFFYCRVKNDTALETY